MKRDAAVLADPGVPAKGIKWNHNVELKKDRAVKAHLPETMRLNERSLFAMLSKYRTVYLKPNRGAFGEGVMQVRRMADREGKRRYRVHMGMRRQTFDTEQRLYAFVKANQLNADYLVQQGIELLRWSGRPFDLRMMISKRSNNLWRNEGFVGRAAHPKKIVTNIRSGGSPVSIDDLLAPYVNESGKRNAVRMLNRLGARICRRLETMYPGIRLFGIDIGLDRNIKPWVIEVNTRPEKICWKCMRKLYKKSK